MQAHPSRPSWNLPPHINYEIARARAGNPLFCPLFGGGQVSRGGLPPLYEDAAHLLKLLTSSGLAAGSDYHKAIVSAADALLVSASNDASGSDCAEYLLYRLQGMPKPGAQKKEAKLRAIIGTFYANLRITQAIARS